MVLDFHHFNTVVTQANYPEELRDILLSPLVPRGGP